jgi:glycine/D-amino acid oxidase-like deaminating enzyme
MARSPDVAVIGAGIVGLAAADALARGGADVVVLERGAPGAGQSAGVARGFRHLHATRDQIAAAVRARALWDEWSQRAGDPLVGEEGALRLGGDVEGDAARLREAGVEAAVVETVGERHPALAPDAGPLLWDPRGGAIRARRTIEWLCRELGGRVRRGEALGVAPGRVDTADGPLACGHVLVCAGAGTERLWPRAKMRRAVHLRVTFGLPGGGAPELSGDAMPGGGAPASWGAATWADRSGRFGALTYGVADGAGRFALGLAELDAQPAPADPAAEVVPTAADLGAIRERLHAYARAAFPGLGAPIDEVVRLLTVLSGPDEDAYLIERRGRMTMLAGHNLFKLAPLLGEEVARRVT